MQERILFVDDDPNILEAYQRRLQKVLRVHVAQGPYVGLREIQEKGPFAVVVADMNMPSMNGIEFLKKVRELAPDTVRMMLTGNSDIKTAMDAVNEGCVFRFLTKPCPSELMGTSLVEAIRQHRLLTAEREVLEGTLKGTAELLTEILSWQSPDTFGHTVQLRNTAKTLATRLNANNPWEIELAATLCQIGMLALPPETLSKATQGASLTDEEQRTLESAPAIGHELIERIPRLETVAKTVLYQNKHFDGKGFPPDSVAGKDILLGSRILKAASDYHELRAAGRSRMETLETMRSRDGWYDPAVLDALGKEPPHPTVAQADEGKVIALPLKDLRPGLTLASPIVTSEGRKLVGAGQIISDAFMVHLRKVGETRGVREPIEVLIRGERP